MVEVGTGSAGSRFLNKDWPITEGLELGTTKLKKEPNLIAKERHTYEKDRVGL